MKKPRSFDTTMAEATRTMSAPQRLLSTVLHNRVLSFLSDILGSTVARPNALFGGAMLSFIVTLSTYLLAKNLGYALSGFEPVGAFIIGWLLGVLYDLIRSVTAKR